MHKMMLVPSNIQSPLTTKVSALDTQMKQILDRTDIDDYTKATMYSQVLNEYLKVRNQINEPQPIHIIDHTQPKIQQIPTPSPQEADNEPQQQQPQNNLNHILELVPKNYRQKAATLLGLIENNPNINFNDKSELVIGDRTIVGSHSVDLVNDLVRPKNKSNPPPTGWSDFAVALKEINIPRIIVGNQDRWRHMTNYNHVPVTPPPSIQTRTVHTAPARRKTYKFGNDSSSSKWESFD